jgi:large subunit ribosomal protein L29
MLKIRTIRDMSRDELEHKYQDLMDEQFNLNMRKSLKSLDNPLRLRIIRREIAKIKTVLNEDSRGIRRLAENATSILPQSGSKDKAKE